MDLTPTIMLVVAFLTNGTPIYSDFILPEGHPCNFDVAVDYTKRFTAASLGSDYSLQELEGEKLTYLCISMPAAIPPGPAMAPPAHIPQDDEA
jgi:hypothetical protein